MMHAAPHPEKGAAAMTRRAAVGALAAGAALTAFASRAAGLPVPGSLASALAAALQRREPLVVLAGRGGLRLLQHRARQLPGAAAARHPPASRAAGPRQPRGAGGLQRQPEHTGRSPAALARERCADRALPWAWRGGGRSAPGGRLPGSRRRASSSSGCRLPVAPCTPSAPSRNRRKPLIASSGGADIFAHSHITINPQRCHTP